MTPSLEPIQQGHRAAHDTIVQALVSCYDWSSEQAKDYLLSWENRQGGPAKRWAMLIDALQIRFPEASSLFSSMPCEPAYLDRIDRLLAMEQAGPALAGPQAAQRDLHLAVVRAVGLFNSIPLQDGSLLAIHDLLREALLHYAQACESQSDTRGSPPLID